MPDKNFPEIEAQHLALAEVSAEMADGSKLLVQFRLTSSDEESAATDQVRLSIVMNNVKQSLVAAGYDVKSIGSTNILAHTMDMTRRDAE